MIGGAFGPIHLRPRATAVRSVRRGLRRRLVVNFPRLQPQPHRMNRAPHSLAPHASIFLFSISVIREIRGDPGLISARRPCGSRRAAGTARPYLAFPKEMRESSAAAAAATPDSRAHRGCLPISRIFIFPTFQFSGSSAAAAAATSEAHRARRRRRATVRQISHTVPSQPRAVQCSRP